MPFKQKVSAVLCCALPQPAAGADAESVNPTAAPGSAARLATPPADSGAQRQRMRIREALVHSGSAAAGSAAARFSNNTSTAVIGPASQSASAAAGMFQVIAPGDTDPLPTRLALFGRRYDLLSGEPVALSSPWFGPATAHGGQMNHLDSFVRCADGLVRRYPADIEGGINFSDQVRLGLVYDAERDFLVRQEAGYAFDQQAGCGAFLVNGKPRAPLPTDSGWQVFRLDDGRMLVPQPSFKACSYACEMMLLLDKGYLQVDDITAKFGPARKFMPSRRIEDVVDGLNRLTGGTAPHQVRRNLNDPSHVREMQALLAQYGPCIVSGPGHVQMLDAITLQGEEVLLALRDPFHGSATTVRRNDALFGVRYYEMLFGRSAAEPEAGPRNLEVDAIFLPPRS